MLTRQRNARYLSQLLEGLEGIHPPTQDSRCTRHGYHLYIFRYIEDRAGISRDRFVEALIAEGIPATTGYTFPLHRNPMFLEKRFINGAFPLNTPYHPDVDYEAFEETCPVAERAFRSEPIWLPRFIFLGDRQDMKDVAEAIRKVLAHRDELG